MGIPFNLFYTSYKSKGATHWNTLPIDVTSASYTNSSLVTGESVSVSVAGQSINYSNSTPTANQSTTIVWDGKDGSGNYVGGSQAVSYTKSTSYDEAAVAAAYPLYEVYYYNAPVGVGPDGDKFFGSLFTGTTPAYKSIGGWDFDIHHFYDPVRKQIYFGDGSALNTNGQTRSNGDVWVASHGRSEVYVFASNGLHSQTRDMLTGVVKYTFAYDTNGNLLSVTDTYSNQTTVQYASGVPVSITSPFGQVTTLSVDANEYLDEVTSPGSKSHTMSYTNDGLLLTFTVPSGVTSTFTYNTYGSLISDSNSAGGTTELSTVQQSTTNAGKTTLIEESPAGRVTQYLRFSELNGQYARKTVYPNGSSEESREYTNGKYEVSDDTNYTSGTETTTDNRFLGSNRTSSTYVYNNGKNVTTNTAVTYTLSNNNDPFSLTSQTTTNTVNSKTYTSVYTASTGSIVDTTPVGRTSTTLIDTQGRTISSQTASYTPTTVAYDTRGRVSQIAQGTSRLTDFNYSSTTGFLTSIVDAASQTTSFSYDTDGRVTSKTLPDSRVVNFAYDANGNLTSVTPPGKQAHSMSYNGLDLLSGYLAPTGTSSNYYYNYDRDLVQITRPNGQSVTFNYTSTTDLLPSMTLPTGNRNFTYSYRRLYTASSEDGYNHTFTNSGTLVTNDAMSSTNFSYSVGYNYNNFTNRNYDLLTVGVAQIQTDYAYDDDQLLTGAGSEVLTRSSTSGFLTQTTLDDIDQNFSYNTYGELSQIEALYNTDNIYKETLTRDVLGRVATKTETYGSGSANVYSFTYDSAGRLTTVLKNSNPFASYSYDSNSNRLSQTVDGITVAPSFDLANFNVGNVNTCAITASGLKCWGYGGNGQNGYANTLSYGDNEALTTFGYVSIGGTAKFVGLGESHTCALLTDKTVRCWGLSTYGQLGLSNTTTIGDNEVPSSVSTVSVGGNVAQITVGGFHTCALKTNNGVTCWGAGSYGRLGYANTDNIGDNETPSSAGEVALGITDTIVQLVSGIAHNCVLTDQGEMKCWGRNEYWQLGRGSINENIGDGEHPSSISMLDLGQDVTMIAAGGYHTCALLANKKVKCWGRNDSGQLGYASTTTSTTALSSLGYVNVGEDVKYISASKTQTCVITVTDKAKCWGANNSGQLGQGNTTTIGDNETPSTIGEIQLSGIPVAIDPGSNHTCAILNDGSMQCWGTGLYGVLGYGNATDVGDNETPQSVGAIPSVNTGSIEYDAQDRLLRFGSKLISYNANGEISSIYDSSTAQTRSFTYDVLGNLKQVVLPSKIINYGVDAFNRRMVKKNGTTAEQYYLWNQNGQLIGVANGSGVLTASFVYGSKAHIPDYMITDTADYQIVSDHLGSPVAVVNSTTGVVAQEIKYDEFGRITADTNPGFIPFGFAGCLYDQDTRLCRFGARDYDASIGRWTAKDPILFAGGDTNLYGYVMQDPVNLIDPSGKLAFLPAIGVGAFVGGIFGVVGEIISNDNVTGGDIVSAFLGGAAGGALTVVGAGATIVGGGSSLLGTAVGAVSGLIIGSAVNLITDPEIIPNPIKPHSPQVCE